MIIGRLVTAYVGCRNLFGHIIMHSIKKNIDNCQIFGCGKRQKKQIYAAVKDAETLYR